MYIVYQHTCILDINIHVYCLSTYMYIVYQHTCILAVNYVYVFRVIVSAIISFQTRRLLGISAEKVVLLDRATKTLLTSHPLRELQQWSTGVGKRHDGLVLEFRTSKSWSLLAPSVAQLKSVTSALWEVMDMEGRFLENTIVQRDVLDFGKYKAKRNLKMYLNSVYS